ncbi:zinc transporter 4, chloroplastic isoform X2 [Selaginella moellendorffii]|uniref:zinc transporter 4, chloroplastic isoform X2 n=1 Tax=Selaginella moellendorffii TaxID=88036 RepID=UPI000D1C5E35|nr:zinc transporter 4, chloroplastic isoform X2 [Selaginella moellendorffii]|eukprot:XP_002969921.2 zinc transporter 4, chloroplastic isoform X2 [Selaginella moellendorffii]
MDSLEWLTIGSRLWTGGLFSMAAVGDASCVPATEFDCRNKPEALKLKAAAMVAILVAGAFGVALPLVGRRLKVIRPDGNVFFLAKALAAGVILATGFVHILPDAMEALTNQCLAEVPWRKFPFAGFIAMIAALGTLVVDFAGTEYFEKKHASKKQAISETIGSEHDSIYAAASSDPEHGGVNGGASGSSERANQMHIVGMRAHASSHRHSHPEGHHSCMDSTHAHSHGHVGHAHGTPEDEHTTIRHVVISQVLELGIVTHSVIIGLSLGVSQSPCTIRPLLAALSFHQFFEGFALGGCISQAGFKSWSSSCMAFFFSVTTPLGIGMGMGISEIYKANSPKALIMEGFFNSVSAGILVYMSLVDLIAADFISKRMRCDRRLQLMSYLALFTGALAMSSLALWA